MAHAAIFGKEVPLDSIEFPVTMFPLKVFMPEKHKSLLLAIRVENQITMCVGQISYTNPDDNGKDLSLLTPDSYQWLIPSFTGLLDLNDFENFEVLAWGDVGFISKQFKAKFR